MKPVHDHVRRADAVIWMTIGLIAIAIAGFAWLGRVERDARSSAMKNESSPACGGHYDVDVIAGTLLAAQRFRESLNRLRTKLSIV